ncbi:MAG: hypothetical protein ABIZ56_05070 [Chthoniobacteraceae bacterium]
MASKRPAKPKERSSSPLDEKRKALAEHERKINDAIERRKRLIEEAPKLKQEQAKQRREELLKRNSRVEAGAGARTSLPDKRFDAHTAAVRPQPRLKREARRGMLTFFVLLAAFACVLTWIYFLLFRSV